MGEDPLKLPRQLLVGLLAASFAAAGLTDAAQPAAAMLKVGANFDRQSAGEVVPAAEITPAAGGPNSLGLSATYAVNATLTTSNGRLTVSSTASVTNDTGSSVSRLTFNLLPAKIGDLQLDATVVGSTPATASVHDQSVIVDLPTDLAPGGHANVRIDYRARLRTTKGDKNYQFAKFDGVFQLYRWVPWLSRDTAFTRPNFGETVVTGSTPRISVRLTTDKVLVVAATGRCTAGCKGSRTQTWVANDVRDFNIAAAANYKTRSLVQPTKHGNVTIVAYYRQLPPSKLLTWAGRAVKRYSNKVGRYPYVHLRIAETAFGGAMESPQMIWLSSNQARKIPYLVAHEVGHQWFYGTVGNDQAAEPFADEALTDFLARDLLGSFARSSCSKRRLDMSVYEYSGKCYYPVIYVQGGNYLNAYRKRVGGTRFWAGIASYYTRYFLDGHGLGGTRKLLGRLDAAAGGLGGGHESRFPSLYP